MRSARAAWAESATSSRSADDDRDDERRDELRGELPNELPDEEALTESVGDERDEREAEAEGVAPDEAPDEEAQAASLRRARRRQVFKVLRSDITLFTYSVRSNSMPSTLSSGMPMAGLPQSRHKV